MATILRPPVISRPEARSSTAAILAQRVPNLLVTTLVVVAALPFLSQDYPNPVLRKSTTAAVQSQPNGWNHSTATFVQPVPFLALDYPNPVIRKSSIASLVAQRGGWNFQTATFVQPTPIIAKDFQNPVIRRSSVAALISQQNGRRSQFTVIPGAIPTGRQVYFANPVLARSLSAAAHAQSSVWQRPQVIPLPIEPPVIAPTDIASAVLGTRQGSLIMNTRGVGSFAMGSRT